MNRLQNKKHINQSIIRFILKKLHLFICFYIKSLSVTNTFFLLFTNSEFLVYVTYPLGKSHSTSFDFKLKKFPLYLSLFLSLSPRLFHSSRPFSRRRCSRSPPCLSTSGFLRSARAHKAATSSRLRFFGRASLCGAKNRRGAKRE